MCYLVAVPTFFVTEVTIVSYLHRRVKYLGTYTHQSRRPGPTARTREDLNLMRVGEGEVRRVYVLGDILLPGEWMG